MKTLDKKLKPYIVTFNPDKIGCKKLLASGVLEDHIRVLVLDLDRVQDDLKIAREQGDLESISKLEDLERQCKLKIWGKGQIVYS